MRLEVIFLQPGDKKFGQHLCAVRKVKKLTQYELSEKCECSEKYLGDIERGKRIPSFKSNNPGLIYPMAEESAPPLPQR